MVSMKTGRFWVVYWFNKRGWSNALNKPLRPPVPVFSSSTGEPVQFFKLWFEEPTETPVVQEAPVDHTYCTASTCFGEVEPSPLMTAHETRVYFESYLGLNGLMLSDTSATDTSDSYYVPGGRTFILETMRRTTRQHGWNPGMYAEP
jgi:hypothetical protein